MAKQLTAVVANARPGPQRREIPDAGCRGLYLIVQPSGRKSWAVRYRVAGKPRKVTFDGALTLAAARKAAAEALHELERGNDPAALKSKTKATAATLAADTVERWAAQFIELHARRRTSRADLRASARTACCGGWSCRLGVAVPSTTSSAATSSNSSSRSRSTGRSWPTARRVISKLFNWLCERDVIVASPCAGVKRPSEETARERVLTDPEIKRLWLACDAIGGPAGACIKTLLLTGQRRSEVAGMRRSEISGDVWSLAGERAKTKSGTTFRCRRKRWPFWKSMPAIAGSDYVFTLGRAPLGHFGRSKQLIDAQNEAGRAVGPARS